MLRGYAKGRDQPLFVKTDNHLIADENDRHAHLPRFLYHLLSLLEIAGDVVLGIRDTLFFQEIFGHLAEMTGRRAVNGDGFIHVQNVMALVYHIWNSGISLVAGRLLPKQ